ncbi:MAG TPA: hypothetical protein VKA46_30775 [Gemmataceae bacterium]|nr:hypothetical protein [Gemmataceae bacterium]
MHKIVRSWCNRWCNQTDTLSEIPLRSGRLQRVPFGVPASQRQQRQRVEGAPHVEQGRVGVHVHGQVDLAVTHRGLSGPRHHPALAEQRPEGVTQGVNVEGPAAVVALRDAGELQVAVENLAELVRHVEERGIGRKPGRDRGAGPAGFLLQPAKLIGEPAAQVRGEVVPQWDVVPLPVLLIGGVEGDERHGVIKAQMCHGEGRQLALAEPGQHQRLVDQRPFPPEPLQTFPHFGAHVGVALALARPLADRQGFEQRPFPGDGEQLDQFGLGHRPALPARVRLLVRLRHGVERVRGQAARLDGPVGERQKGAEVTVASAGSHAGPRLSVEPAFEGFAAQVGEGNERTVGSEPAQLPRSFRAVFLASALGFEICQVGVKVPRERRSLVVPDRGFGGSHDFGAHQFGAALEVGQHLPGGGFVAAAGRNGPHHSGAVAVLGDEVGRFGDDALGAVLPHGKRRGAGLARAILPSGEALALADDGFHPGR